MTRSSGRVLAGVAAFTLLLFGAFLLHSYYEVQQQISLEGRRLHSPEAIQVSLTPNETIALIDRLPSGFRALVDLDDSGLRRGLVAPDLDVVEFPQPLDQPAAQLREGSALAGSAVELSEASLVLGEDAYRVVGRLGLGRDSLLAYTAIVADRRLFAAAGISGTVVIDGPNAAQEFASVAPDAHQRPVHSGATDRTNVDEISPIIVRLGAASIALGAVLTGMVLGGVYRPWLKVRFLLGGHPYVLRFQAHAALTAICLVGLACAILLSLAVPAIEAGSFAAITCLIWAIASVAFQATLRHSSWLR